MPFWKKSEDPWDRKPEKKRVSVNPYPDETAAEQKTAQIPDWYRTEESPVPMDCPRCGKPMLCGVLYGNSRGGVQWREGPYCGGLDALRFTGRKIDLSGSETSWYCASCRMLTLDVEGVLEKAGPNYVWKNGKPCPVEEEENHDL